MSEYFTLDPNEVVIPEEEQQKIREADYIYNNKKTIVYNANEEFKIYSKNNNYAISNYGTMYSFIKKKKLNPSIGIAGTIQYTTQGKNITASRAVLETFNPVENSNKLKILYKDGNVSNLAFDKKNDKINLEWSHFGQNPENFDYNKTQLPENIQQKIRESDYINKKKCIVYYKDEQFKVYPNNNNYIIGSYGDIYNLNKGRKVSPYLDKDGYYQCYIGIPYREHRAVLETFNPVENSNELQVNHIDCNKTRNIFDSAKGRVNLEWCTCEQNIEHADKMGHRGYLTKKNKSLIRRDKDEIYKICELMNKNKNYTFRQIANELGIDFDSKFKNLISSIKHKRSWLKISNQFSNLQENIDHYIIRDEHKLQSDENHHNHHKAKYKEQEIYDICRLMAQNKTGRQIANELGMEYTPQLQDLTTKIRKKESWKNISDKFPEIQPRYRWNKNK